MLQKSPHVGNGSIQDFWLSLHFLDKWKMKFLAAKLFGAYFSGRLCYVINIVSSTRDVMVLRAVICQSINNYPGICQSRQNLFTLTPHTCDNSYVSIYYEVEQCHWLHMMLLNFKVTVCSLCWLFCVENCYLVIEIHPSMTWLHPESCPYWSTVSFVMTSKCN